jgi:hypothetical protein
MKLSVLTILAAAVLATASVIPCDHHAETDVTDSFTDFDVSENTVFITKERCLLPCLPRRPQCPKHFHGKKRGNCWKCCKRLRHAAEVELDEEDEGLYDFEDFD